MERLQVAHSADRGASAAAMCRNSAAADPRNVTADGSRRPAAARRVLLRPACHRAEVSRRERGADATEQLSAPGAIARTSVVTRHAGAGRRRGGAIDETDRFIDAATDADATGERRADAASSVGHGSVEVDPGAVQPSRLTGRDHEGDLLAHAPDAARARETTCCGGRASFTSGTEPPAHVGGSRPKKRSCHAQHVRPGGSSGVRWRNPAAVPPHLLVGGAHMGYKFLLGSRSRPLQRPGPKLFTAEVLARVASTKPHGLL